MLYLISREDPATPSFLDVDKQYVVTNKSLSADDKAIEIMPILNKSIKKTNLTIEHINIWGNSYTFVIKEMNISAIYFHHNSYIYRAFCPFMTKGIAKYTHVNHTENYLPITTERIWGNKDFFTSSGNSKACSSPIKLNNILKCSAYFVDARFSYEEFISEKEITPKLKFELLFQEILADG
ncbi:MAG: hypothetical protein E7231_00040 [Cellulosilyticum sp.]|nr:hypothetical protein [Cellulosilyticum sp.]